MQYSPAAAPANERIHNSGRNWVSMSDMPGVPLLLRLVMVTIFVFPADMVVSAVGAIGFVAMLLALALFGLWLASVLFGLHNPILDRHPGRIGLGAFWVASIISYLGMSDLPTSVLGKAAADRWMLVLCGITGIALVTTERVRTGQDALSFSRALIGGATFCGIIALYQFAFHADPVGTIRSIMIGFHENGGNTVFQSRGNLMRVSGTTFHPIELGVVGAMVAPIAVWRSLFDTKGRRYWHWIQVGIILLASVLTVSRSAVLSLFVAGLAFIPFMPILARRWCYILLPAALVGVFAAIPGLVATIFGSITAGSADPSLTTRTNNYPRVEALVSLHPVSGLGPGTFIPANALEIVDNQYLQTAIEMGLIGVLGLVLLFVLPTSGAFAAARRAKDPQLRSFCGAVAAAGLVAIIGSGTFDSLSFPVFTVVLSAYIGLSGSAFLAVKRELGLSPGSGTSD